MNPNVELLHDLSQTTHDLIQALRERHASSEKKKVLKRRWKLTDAAQILGISESHLRRLAREGKIPAGEPTRSQCRSYSLNDLNIIRQRLGREPYRVVETRGGRL